MWKGHFALIRYIILQSMLRSKRNKNLNKSWKFYKKPPQFCDQNQKYYIGINKTLNFSNFCHIQPLSFPKAYQIVSPKECFISNNQIKFAFSGRFTEDLLGCRSWKGCSRKQDPDGRRDHLTTMTCPTPIYPVPPWESPLDHVDWRSKVNTIITFAPNHLSQMLVKNLPYAELSTEIWSMRVTHWRCSHVFPKQLLTHFKQQYRYVKGNSLYPFYR